VKPYFTPLLPGINGCPILRLSLGLSVFFDYFKICSPLLPQCPMVHVKESNIIRNEGRAGISDTFLLLSLSRIFANGRGLTKDYSGSWKVCS
jgi:hypothetical protein